MVFWLKTFFFFFYEFNYGILAENIIYMVICNFFKEQTHFFSNSSIIYNYLHRMKKLHFQPCPKVPPVKHAVKEDQNAITIGHVKSSVQMYEVLLCGILFLRSIELLQ